MQHVGAAGALVKIVDILGDHRHVIPFFKLGERAVRIVGLRFHKLGTAGIVKIVNQGRITVESGGTGHLHHGIVFPEAAGIAVGLDAAFSTDACSGEHNEFGEFHFCHVRDALDGCQPTISISNTRVEPGSIEPAFCLP